MARRDGRSPPDRLVSATPGPSRRLVFLADASSLPAARADTTVVVLDPAWTPPPGGRADVVPIRTVFGRVTAEHDLFDSALELIDAWEAGNGIADRLLVDGVTYWFRMRETMWRWVHERLLWRHALSELGVTPGSLTFEIPSSETALRDVASRLGSVRIVDDGPSGSPVTAAPPRAERAAAPIPAMLRRAVRRMRPVRRTSPTTSPTSSPIADGPADVDVLTPRLQAMIEDPRPRVVVLTTPTTYQRVAAAATPRDPILASVVDSLERLGAAVTLVAIGLDDRRDEDRAILAADPRMLPMSMFRRRWGAATDPARADAARSSLAAVLAELAECRFDLDGLDLTEAFIAELTRELLRIVDIDVPQRARIERFLEELRPQAIALAQEGIRLPWLMAAHDRGIPVFAVQHGILYEGHPGYPHRRHPAFRRPATTFVYGPYERDVLVRRGAYQPDEVSVVGSPRLDLDGSAGSEAGSASDRDGPSAPGLGTPDRTVVISTVNVPFVRRAHLAPMLERILGGPLPHTHLVFKLHPGERDEGPYRALIEGLAAAGGYAAPPVTVVRDIDLLGLLRSADAHLGMHSTVLTDAVAAGTMNLIAMTDKHADILGYVPAGVAVPVRTRAELLAALDAPSRPDAATRRAFLERHLRPGPAGPRIATAIMAAIEENGIR
jgi:hypothetical protein